MIIALSLLVAIIGLLMYALAANPKLVRVGEIMFFCGLLAFLINIKEIITVIGH
jgi:hypothetical protein